MATFGVLSILYFFFSAIIGAVFMIVSLVLLIMRRIPLSKFVVHLAITLVVVIAGAIAIAVLGVFLHITGIFPAFPDHM